jgi:hypothetical protein
VTDEPGLSRRGLFGAGLRNTLARLEAAAPRVPAAPPPPAAPARLPVTPEAGALAPVAQEMVEMAGVEQGQSVLVADEVGGPVAEAVERRGAFMAVVRAVPFDARGESFDAVLAFFGAAEHPQPRELAAELARVARPSAPIVIAAWSTQPWSRYETAYRHFFDFPDFDVHERRLPGLERDYALVFSRKP